jgi:hypothetical protein
MYALNPCNAQYKFATTDEDTHGVSRRAPYMHRLLVTDQAPISILPLLSNAPPFETLPTGDLADAQAGNFVEVDSKSTAETKAFTNLMMLGQAIGGSVPILRNCSITLVKLTSRASTDKEHANNVVEFNAQLSVVLENARIRGTKQLLLDRLHHKAGN